MEIWTLALSIIGALAWVPIIITPAINHFRRVQANLFEFRVLSNGYARSAGEQRVIEGAIVLMVVNFFIKNADYYPTNVKAAIKLKNGNRYNAELSDCSSVVSANDDGTFSCFCLPTKLEFNVSRTIRKNDDNVKCIALIIDGISNIDLNDLESINMELYSGSQKKVVTINSPRLPTFNCTQLLKGYEIQTTVIDNPELAEYLKMTQMKK